jgi:hypothetical protein
MEVFDRSLTRIPIEMHTKYYTYQIFISNTYQTPISLSRRATLIVAASVTNLGILHKAAVRWRVL